MAHRRRTREQWRRLVAGWRDSGLTQAQYCERHGISVASLHRWREIFRAAVGAATPAPSERKPRDAVHLLPIELLDDLGSAAAGGAGQALSLVFPDGVRLEIAPGCDDATLRRVVGVLREAAAS
jgi:transposase-like protein